MTPGRLQRLEEMICRFEDHRYAENFFIGALSANVSDEVWDKCIQLACKHADVYGKKRVTKGEDHDNQLVSPGSTHYGR